MCTAKNMTFGMKQVLIEKDKKTKEVEKQECDVYECDSCYNKICPGCDNIGDCVKCNKTLCYDCCQTFWCYECENGFCYDCEERADVYCKPCAIKINLS